MRIALELWLLPSTSFYVHLELCVCISMLLASGISQVGFEEGRSYPYLGR